MKLGIGLGACALFGGMGSGDCDWRAEAERLRLQLAQSEAVLDNTESFMANLSRKAYQDGEKLQKQNGVIRRYTPHDVWSRVGENAARGASPRSRRTILPRSWVPAAPALPRPQEGRQPVRRAHRRQLGARRPRECGGKGQAGFRR